MTVISKSVTGALTIGFIASAILFASPPANAFVVNNNIHINKDRLKAKCKRSGGTYSESGKSYGCTVSRPDGGTTTVNCNHKRNCVGIAERFGSASQNRPSTSSSGNVATR